MRIEIPVFDGFDELDTVGPYEVLRNANQMGADAGWDVALVGEHGPGEVVAAHGLRLSLTDSLGHPDAVLAPGGGWTGRTHAGPGMRSRPGSCRRALPSWRYPAAGWRRCALGRYCSRRPGLPAAGASPPTTMRWTTCAAPCTSPTLTGSAAPTSTANAPAQRPAAPDRSTNRRQSRTVECVPQPRSDRTQPRPSTPVGPNHCCRTAVLRHQAVMPSTPRCHDVVRPCWRRSQRPQAARRRATETPRREGRPLSPLLRAPGSW